MKILLCCGAGMSSGYLAQYTRKAAKKRKMNVSIEARSHSDIGSYLSSIDILMVGPHYAGELKEFENMAKPYDIPVCVIPQNIYGQLDGDKLLEYAMAEIEKYNQSKQK